MSINDSINKTWQITKWCIGKIGSDIRSAIVALIVGSLIVGGTIFVFAKNLWFFLCDILQSNTPLWATILLVLLGCVLTYLKVEKSQPSSPPSLPDSQIHYFDIGNLRWKTKIYNHGYYEVERNPLCKTHDLPFVSGSENIFCPEVGYRKCENIIPYNKLNGIHEMAKSYIDKKIRNKEY